ncbi:Secondary metabolism regulator laeA [Beauveria bassiana]|nr:Secondary metabolism regulator laeA [Beauveria bassiana]
MPTIARHTACQSGVIHQVEIDWVPQWEDTAAPSNSALLQWSQLFLKGMDGFQRSARVSGSKVRHMMEAAGYIDFDEIIIRCCVSPWCDDAHEKLVAKWFNIGLTEAVEAMSLAPLVEKLGMDVSEVKDLCERLRNEICTLRYHAYFNIHLWTAKKP